MVALNAYRRKVARPRAIFTYQNPIKVPAKPFKFVDIYL